MIPSPLPFSIQVLLGGRDRDFLTHNASIEAAVRAAAREPHHAKTGASDDMRLDLALQLNAQMSRWQHLLLQASSSTTAAASNDDDDDPLYHPVVAEEQSYDERYPPQARQADPALDQALQELEAAQRALDSEEGGDVDRGTIKEMYRRSLALRPTADAHTYLAFLLAYDGDFEVRALCV